MDKKIKKDTPKPENSQERKDFTENEIKAINGLVDFFEGLCGGNLQEYKIPMKSNINMTEEEKKAIEFLKETCFDPLEYEEGLKSIEIVLNLIQKQDRELQQVLNDYQELGKDYHKLECESEQKDTEINKLNNKNNELLKDKVYLQEENTKAYAKYWNAMKCIDKLNNIIDRIKNYAYQEVAYITEDIKDYIDDDKEGNKNIIGEFKETREQWKDIMRIIEGKADTDLYVNWKEWGEYE